MISGTTYQPLSNSDLSEALIRYEHERNLRLMGSAVLALDFVSIRSRAYIATAFFFLSFPLLFAFLSQNPKKFVPAIHPKDQRRTEKTHREEERKRLRSCPSGILPLSSRLADAFCFLFLSLLPLLFC